ncbi:hypothetical protein [Intestinibacter bartlettii]|uniref:Bacteriophage replication protein O n=1 Tax=Intestinibacter bartlettii TaxID=261299 RepID=A0ABS6DV43_9FIRM|nr:hypothetical protein [Intestinibacter bartlettii]MBU5335474.1 hypothetical protein [Intestinibacter bartlettii]
MKYTVSGFFQPAAQELGLDYLDLGILRWFVDFKNTGKMISKKLQGKIYYWVSYKAIVSDLPTLRLQKDAIYRRLRKMCNLGVLKKRVVCDMGKYSFYAFDKNYLKLIKCEQMCEGASAENPVADSDGFDDNFISGDFNDNFGEGFIDDDFVDNAFNNLGEFIDEGSDFSPCSPSVDSSAEHVDLKPDQIEDNPNAPVLNPEQNINLLNQSIKSHTHKSEQYSPEVLAQLLLCLIRQHNPKFKTPNMKHWIKTFDCILKYDERDPKEVYELIKWVHTESAFWSCQILSPSNLRKHYDRLICRRNYESNKFVPRSLGQTAVYDAHETQENSMIINSIYGSYNLVGFEDI